MERRSQLSNLKGIEVRAGEISVTQDGEALIAVLGSNVSVCVWDTAGRIAGMNNFSEPATYDAERATARFGNVATVKLIDMIRERCADADLEAHIFGGASPRDGCEAGNANVAMARSILSRRCIPVVSEDVGGRKGRKIMFDTTSGHVAVLKVHDIRKDDWGA
ncbi:MAG: hypothetical protein GF418_04430 [Chitinivibrionales bacterium]|nr:hypothetical protein [Chitinivibrionales bacterium]